MQRQSIVKILMTFVILLSTTLAFGQEEEKGLTSDNVADSILIDSLDRAETFRILPEDSTAIVKAAKKQQRDWATWKPDPKRAMWLGILIPGAGQIYNRKYWKLPIIYGGFVGCAYAMRWNNQMYKDYAQAYIDIMDNNPATESYNKFLHLGMEINESNKDRYTKIFKSRKDKYRRWRDMSFFCMVGVYALSIIDAYVDASLSQFDISDDLSLRVEPGFVGTSTTKRNANPINNTGLGVNCSLSF